MPELIVYAFPNPILKKKGLPVFKFNTKLKQLADRMAEAMYQHEGIGLAAPQVGVSLRMFIADLSYKGPEGDSPKAPVAFCNPVLSCLTGEISLDEGCLSVPEFRTEIQRYDELTLDYQDLEGRHQQLHAQGLLAVCIQHETDHLNGKLFIDHLSPLRRKMVEKKLRKLAK